MRNIKHTSSTSEEGLISAGKGLHHRIRDEKGKMVVNARYEAYSIHVGDLKKAFKEYDNLTNPCRLESLSKMSFSTVHGDAIGNLYSREKAFIKTLWHEVTYNGDGEYIVCPLCGQKTVTDLDHYVPRAIMPEYAVHVLNLIPTCHECNNDKGDKWLNHQGKRIIFNAYFDVLPDVSNLLDCQLSIESESDFPHVTITLNETAITEAGEIGRLVKSTYNNIENVRILWQQKASHTIKNKTNEIIRSIDIHKKLGAYNSDSFAIYAQKQVLNDTYSSLLPFEFIEKVVLREMLNSASYESWLLSRIRGGAVPRQKQAYILNLKCDRCRCTFEVNLEDHDLSWEIVETEERNMGAEIHHQAIVDLECLDCDNCVTLILDVWEYPLGAFNTSSVEVEGASLIGEACSLNGFAPIGEDDLSDMSQP